jgi:Tol biopolymer transport system component
LADPSLAAQWLIDQRVVSTPHAASDPTSILFVSARNGVADIYRTNEAGTEQVRLTQNGRNNESPTWSPDGQKIAFLSHEVGATDNTAISHLYVMDPDGSGVINLASELDQSVIMLTWSPDSQRIAFVAVSTPEGGAFLGMNIYVVNRDGSELTQVTEMSSGTVGCWSPTWSPDNSQLVYVCRAAMQVGIGIANADGTGHWGMERGQVNRVFWLPSGESIGFTRGACTVGVLSAEYLLTKGVSGSAPSSCLDQDCEALGVASTSPYVVGWSPMDVTLFAVQTTESLQIVDLANYAVTEAHFRSTRLNGPPSWAPEADRIAFAALGGNDSEIYILNLATNEVVQLTDNEVDDFMPAWQP